MTTSPQPPFQMWGWPGPNAVAAIEADEAGDRYLCLFLDPVNLVITVPPFPDGPRVLAGFYRRLARVSAQLAGELDPGTAVIVPGDQGRHRARVEGEGWPG
jgi:hypothetical protein